MTWLPLWKMGLNCITLFLGDEKINCFSSSTSAKCFLTWVLVDLDETDLPLEGRGVLLCYLRYGLWSCSQPESLLALLTLRPHPSPAKPKSVVIKALGDTHTLHSMVNISHKVKGQQNVSSGPNVDSSLLQIKFYWDIATPTHYTLSVTTRHCNCRTEEPSQGPYGLQSLWKLSLVVNSMGFKVTVGRTLWSCLWGSV